jgi:hypothetical protein
VAAAVGYGYGIAVLPICGQRVTAGRAEMQDDGSVEDVSVRLRHRLQTRNASLEEPRGHRLALRREGLLKWA